MKAFVLSLLIIIFLSTHGINSEIINKKYESFLRFDPFYQAYEGLQRVLTSHDDSSVKKRNENNIKINDYLRMTRDFEKNLEDFFIYKLKDVLNGYEAKNEQEEQCISQMGDLANELLKGNFSSWAFTVLDAIGKPGSGVKQGNTKWVGEYAACKRISEPINFANGTFKNQWEGKYCLVLASTLSAVLKTLVGFGICVPSPCTPDLLNGLLSQVNSLGINPIVGGCQEPKKINSLGISALSVFGFLIFLVVLATFLDILKQFRPAIFSRRKFTTKIQTESTVNNFQMEDKEDKIQAKKEETLTEPLIVRILLSFSAYTNTSKIFKINRNSNDQLLCLNGIRFLSLSWVILGHTIAFALIPELGQLTIDAYWMQSWIKRFSFMIILSGYFSVDSFFLLSGLLNSYLFIKEIREKRKGFSAMFLVKYYVHRLWRITPPYMLVLFFSVSLSGYLGSGPFYPEDGFDANCKESWWTNLLYINNIYKRDKLCLGVTWYLANDMQFYWIAPIILVPFALGTKKGRLFSLIISGVLIVVNILSTALIINAYPGTEIGPLDSKNFVEVYVVPWCRIGPFIIGILLGFILYEVKKRYKNFEIPLYLNMSLWFLSLFMIALMTWGPWPNFNGQGHELSKGANITYQATCKIIWSVALSYIIFACSTGNGGFINSFLSLDLWIPLARLSFSAYLIHSTIVYYFYFTQERLIHFQDINILYILVGHVFLTHIAAYFVTLICEIPFVGLEKFIFKHK